MKSLKEKVVPKHLPTILKCAILLFTFLFMLQNFLEVNVQKKWFIISYNLYQYSPSWKKAWSYYIYSEETESNECWLIFSLYVPLFYSLPSSSPCSSVVHNKHGAFLFTLTFLQRSSKTSTEVCLPGDSKSIQVFNKYQLHTDHT